MRSRSDGSFQSANTPTWANVGLKEDYNLYRCMVTKVFYVDDPKNVTKNAQNPEVVYQVVILGGFKSGQTLTNVRLSTDLGGTDNYSETVLTPASKPITDTRLSDQDGDIVFVQFIQGHQGYPQIIATGNGIKDQSGTKKADGPRKVSQYNGVNQLINNKGEFIITRKGGSLDSSTGKFKPGTSMDSQISMTDGTVTITTKSGSKVIVDGKNNKITVVSGSTEIDVDGASGKISLKGATVDLGKSVSDFVPLFTQLLTAFNSHTHIGNLGSPTSPPTAPMPSSAGSQTVQVQS